MLLSTVLISFIIINEVSSEYCYYRENKENKNNYLDCEFFDRDLPIEGISLIHLKHNTTIPVIKKGLISDFKNLKTLYITAANVEKIEVGALDNFKLEIIDFYHNNIKTIENGTFNSLGTLKYLDLSFNKIEMLEGHTFKGLTALEWLSLNSNLIKTINVTTFNHMKNLKALYIHFNNISHLEVGTFKNLVSLELLDLSFNSIKNVEFGLFSDFKKLQTLFMKHNKIEKLGDRLFNNMTSLTALDISQNNITKLQDNLFKKTKNLVILKFTSNKLTELNATNLLEHAPKLEEVHLYYNQWNCSSLKNMTIAFAKSHIFIPTVTPVLESNILGIGCR